MIWKLFKERWELIMRLKIVYANSQVPLSPWQQMPQYNVSTKCYHMITIIKANEFKFYFRELH